MARFIPRRLFASQLFESEPLARDLRCRLEKAIRVSALAVVKSKSLFVEVAEEVKWFDAYVSTTQRTLEQAPNSFRFRCYESARQHIAPRD